MSDPLALIANRVESLEGRFDENISKINGRLDQIVDLMTKVTQLQEREIRNADHINELKVGLKESNISVRDWNQRIHERLDYQQDQIKDCRSESDKHILQSEEKLYTKISTVATNHQTTREEFQKWFNRGIGAWIVASFLLVILQSMGAYIISGIIDANKETLKRLETIESRALSNERTITEMWKASKRENNIAP